MNVIYNIHPIKSKMESRYYFGIGFFSLGSEVFYHEKKVYFVLILGRDMSYMNFLIMISTISYLV